MNRKIPTLLAILIIFVVIATIAGIVFWLFPDYPENEVAYPQTENVQEETADWQTYRNEEVGIEFDYPSYLDASQLVIADNSQTEYPEIYSGKKIVNFFRNPTRGIYMSFGAYTSDYKGFKESPFTGNEDISLACLEQLSYSDEGDVCKMITLPWGKAILANDFWGDEGDVGLRTEVYFNNITNSEYKGLEFRIELRDINNRIRNLFAEDKWGGERVYSEARIQSENIINQKNLSEKDKNALKLFNQVLSTLRFIEIPEKVTQDETADWQTYRNEEYEFEIKYPKDWNYGPNILKTEPNIVFCPPEFSDLDPSLKCQWKSGNGHMSDSLAPIYLFVSEKPGGTFTLDDLSMHECKESEKRTINNILMKISQCEERGQEAIWYSPGNVYIFRLFLKDNLFLYTFNQILSTFRFLD